MIVVPRSKLERHTKYYEDLMAYDASPQVRRLATSARSNHEGDVYECTHPASVLDVAQGYSFFVCGTCHIVFIGSGG